MAAAYRLRRRLIGFCREPRVVCMADATLRTYAHELLHFLRWWESVHHTDAVAKDALTETTLLDYVRFQSGQERELTGATINQRVAIVDRALRVAFPGAPGQSAPVLQTTYWQRAPMGIGKPRSALSRLRVRTPKRTIVPLSADEVARFWSSFRNSRDLAIVGLMLLQGLRSQEVLDLNRDDLLLSEAQIRVRGKGNKTRFLPLAPEANQLLDHSLRLERPPTSTNALFVSLKGPARGARMTPAGLRSLFRHHRRRTTGVKMANPHRFRHTFASDMVRAGVSLPALMQLMGHAQIQTTMVYVQVTPLPLLIFSRRRLSAEQARADRRKDEYRLAALRYGQAIRFFSCFISYSTVDQGFAHRLYEDLQNEGVRCWFAPHDIKSGKKLHEQIGEAIRLYDRLLLILSEDSMSSEWVKTEIAQARRKEQTQRRQVLFPISLVPFGNIREWQCFDAVRVLLIDPTKRD